MLHDRMSSTYSSGPIGCCSILPGPIGPTGPTGLSPVADVYASGLFETLDEITSSTSTLIFAELSESSGVTRLAGNTQLYLSEPGTYFFSASIQLGSTDGTQVITFLRINGTTSALLNSTGGNSFPSVPPPYVGYNIFTTAAPTRIDVRVFVGGTAENINGTYALFKIF